LHSYGLAEGYDKQVVGDIIDVLIEALVGTANARLTHAQINADGNDPNSPAAP
jgi:hypothetical protein